VPAGITLRVNILLSFISSFLPSFLLCFFTPFVFISSILYCVSSIEYLLPFLFCFCLIPYYRYLYLFIFVIFNLFFHFYFSASCFVNLSFLASFSVFRYVVSHLCYFCVIVYWCLFLLLLCFCPMIFALFSVSKLMYSILDVSWYPSFSLAYSESLSTTETVRKESMDESRDCFNSKLTVR
jgi:hypothetical protein